MCGPCDNRIETAATRYEDQLRQSESANVELAEQNRVLKRQNQELQRRLDAVQIRSVDVVPGSTE